MGSERKKQQGGLVQHLSLSAPSLPAWLEPAMGYPLPPPEIWLPAKRRTLPQMSHTRHDCALGETPIFSPPFWPKCQPGANVTP